MDEEADDEQECASGSSISQGSERAEDCIQIVHDLEELVVSVPNWADAHYDQPSLRN